MPTLVRNSQVVLIVSLICHDERVYEEMIFCKTSLRIKVNCIFLYKKQDLYKTYLKQQSTLLPRKS